MDRIEGIPEGYRLGALDDIQYADYAETVPTYISFELIPIEQPKRLDDHEDRYLPDPCSLQPKQLEAVIVVPISEVNYGWEELDAAISSAEGLSPDEAYRLKRMYPDRVTIREREKGAK